MDSRRGICARSGASRRGFRCDWRTRLSSSSWPRRRLHTEKPFFKCANENRWTVPRRHRFVTRMWRISLALLLFASSAFAAERGSAYEALRVVGTQFHRAALARIISVTGVDGDPQPARWTILIADRAAPGGVRELVVANGRIVSNHVPSGSVTGTASGA